MFIVAWQHCPLLWPGSENTDAVIPILNGKYQMLDESVCSTGGCKPLILPDNLCGRACYRLCTSHFNRSVHLHINMFIISNVYLCISETKIIKKKLHYAASRIMQMPIIF